MRALPWLTIVPLRLRSLFRRSEVEQELDGELRYHLERQIEANIANGLSPDEARYALLRASLSLGIGATGAIFTLLNAVVLRDLPVKNPEQLVSLFITTPGRRPNWSLPYPQFEAMRARNTALDALTAVNTIGRVSVSAGDAPELAAAQAVSGDYYQMLGVAPHDPVAFGGATLVLMTMGCAASIIPATRASRIDPITALKYE
jgi:ABC-type antimicrobial peptide transport system permease subunit